jgi:hypothetical protein
MPPSSCSLLLRPLYLLPLTNRSLAQVPHKRTMACEAQTDEDLDSGGEVMEGGVTLKDIMEHKRMLEEGLKEKELDTWRETKCLHDEDDVEVVDEMDGKELAPVDQVSGARRVTPAHPLQPLTRDSPHRSFGTALGRPQGLRWAPRGEGD